MKYLSDDQRSKLMELSFKKQYLNVVEASVYTGFTPKYIYQLVNKGLIPHYKPTGRKLFFKIEDLDEWISTSKCKSVNEIYLDFENGSSNL
jgi:excisionase family DNA binding protein